MCTCVCLDLDNIHVVYMYILMYVFMWFTNERKPSCTTTKLLLDLIRGVLLYITNPCLIENFVIAIQSVIFQEKSSFVIKVLSSDH